MRVIKVGSYKDAIKYINDVRWSAYTMNPKLHNDLPFDKEKKK